MKFYRMISPSRIHVMRKSFLPWGKEKVLEVWHYHDYGEKYWVREGGNKVIGATPAFLYRIDTSDYWKAKQFNEMRHDFILSGRLKRHETK